MSLSEIFGQRVLAAVSGYIHPADTSEEAQQRLFLAAKAVESVLDLDGLKQDAEALHAATEKGTRLNALEALTSKVSRAILEAAVGAIKDPLSKQSRSWISSNVTAHSRYAFRVKAIWRNAAGLGDDSDASIHDHAVKSALEGTTIEPAPGADPEPSPKPGTEAKMTNPTETRDAILKVAAFNPAGLPKALRELRYQKIYLDAIVQATALLGHPPDEDDAVAWALSAAALMLLDGNFDPHDQRFFAHVQKAVAELSGSADETGTIKIDDHPLTMIAPDPDNTQRISIFKTAFKILRANARKGAPIFLQSYALAGRNAVDRYDDHKGDANLMEPVVTATYDTHVTTAASGGGGYGIANVDLPPLYDPQGYNDEIEPDNVRAVATIYVTYQLEFAIKGAGRILDLFVAGLLPISASDGNARELDSLYWDQSDLLDEASRRSVYARVLGAPGGEMAFDVQPNTEFNTMLMRVVSAVSEFEREQSVLTHFDNAARGRRLQSTSGEFVRKAVRDFAANASLRGWAGTAFAAERMAGHVRRIMRILNLPSVKTAYGVTTPWQVVERVSQREFGITVNTVLHRTLAVETQRIMQIIADYHTIWSNGAGLRPLFSETNRNEGELPLETTRELMIACQHFRAVTGVGDALLDEYSQPEPTAPQPSLPDIGGIGGMAGMAMPGVDMGGITQLRDMVNSGQAPSLEQLRSMLPGF